MRHSGIFFGILWRAASTRALFVVAMLSFAASSLAPDSAHARSFKVLQSFCTQADCDDGEAPGGLTRDGAGNLYGTTGGGGQYGRGTVFKLRLNPATGQYTREILHHFCSAANEINCEDGAYPTGGLIRDKFGNLYGTTYQGGGVGCATGMYLKGCGVVFALLYNSTTRTYTLRRLLSFDGTGTHTQTKSGSASPVGLVMDGAGNLYGSAVGGGANDDYGAVFKLTPNADKTRWSHRALYTFCRLSSCRDGRGVYARPAIDRLGNLYGTTFEGGANDMGTVFALLLNRSTGAYTFKSIYSFCATCGFSSANAGEVSVDRDGNLFGTTEWDTGEGTVFKLTPNAGRTAWAYKVLRRFCSQAGCSDGATPSTNLVIDGDGNVFGGAKDGGRAGDHGALFQLTPDATGTAYAYRVLYRFCGRANCADGSRPNSLVMDDAGNLFASTSFGGAGADGGVVVELVND